MKLLDLTWTRYRVPLRAPFRTAHGVLTQRHGALVTVRTDDGYTGYGEIAPLPAYRGPDLAEALAPLPNLARSLRGRELADILDSFETETRQASTCWPAPLIYGLETALLDARGQAGRQRVADLLANAPARVRARIPVNTVSGGITTEAVVASARAAIASGFTCLKLKLTDAAPAALERVAAVRDAIGYPPRLRLDANESWSRDQARTLLTACAAYDIEYVEQPLPADDLAGMVSLRRSTPIPLAVDEALTSLESARRILQAGAADVLILKPQLIGSLYTCRRIIQEADAQGIACVITSTLETGIGITMALHLAAASPEITLPCGLATLALLESDLLQTGPSIRRGQIDLPAGPGLGVHPDLAALTCFSFPDESL